MSFLDNWRNALQQTVNKANAESGRNSGYIVNSPDSVSPSQNSNSPAQYSKVFQDAFSQVKEIPELKNGFYKAMSDPRGTQLANLWVTWKDKNGNFGEGAFLVDKNSMEDGKLNIFGYKEYNPEYGWNTNVQNEWLHQLDAGAAIDYFEKIRKNGGKIKMNTNNMRDWDKSEILWEKNR